MKFTAFTEDLEDLIVVTIKWDIICMQTTHSCLRLDLLSLVTYYYKYTPPLTVL